MDNTNLLMIFVKNPEKGKVKTRLAARVGDDKAFRIYLKLLKHTLKIAQQAKAEKQVWYSSFIDSDDKLEERGFAKKLQSGQHLGERMEGAFQKAFESGHKNVVIIGSDCPDITAEVIEEAFNRLDQDSTDVVIGPSEDGGYYLLGMNSFYPGLFRGIEWSTGQVLPSTLDKIKKLELRKHMLKELNDIDTLQDLEKSNFL